MLAGLTLIPLTLMIAILRKEPPRTVLLVGLISWVMSTLWQWTYTMGFESYGNFIIYIFVIPALIVILITCKIYFSRYNPEDKADKPRSKWAPFLIPIWVAAIVTSYIAVDIEPVFDIVDDIQRAVLSEEQLHQLHERRNQKEWQKSSKKLSSKFSGGTGTAEDPFQIATVTELKAIEQALPTYQPFYFLQTADIYILPEDLNYQGFWDPIGDAAEFRNVGFLLGSGYSMKIIDCVAYIKEPVNFGQAGGLLGTEVGCTEFVNSGIIIVEE